MRTSSLARVVMASLGVAVGVTLGCVPPPPAPTPAGPSTTFSVQSIYPAEGLSAGATVAMIAGTGFQSGDTVTVDGSRVDATVLSANTISITMPAHAAGNVDVTVISAISQARASVPGGYSYVPPEPSAAQRNAVFALFDAAIVHAGATTSLLTYGTDRGKAMWTNGPCAFGQGSMQGSLDGGSAPTPGTFLPTGSHTYVVSFTNCPVNYWGFDYFELHGVASAAYSVAEWSNITAMVSAESVRGQGLPYRSELWDVTADGSAVWTRSSNDSTTYTPAPGSRLVNNLTTNVAIFGGGSYSLIRSSSQGTPSMSFRFDNLQVAVNGTEYTLNGSLVEISTSRITFTGEIRINNNGTLVARIYGDGNKLRVEVLVPLVPL